MTTHNQKPKVQYTAQMQEKPKSRSRSRSQKSQNLLHMRPISRKKSEKKIQKMRKAQRERLNRAKNKQKNAGSKSSSRHLNVANLIERDLPEDYNGVNLEFESPSVQFLLKIKENKLSEAIKVAKKYGMDQINVNILESETEKWSPLHYAVINGNISAVNILIHSGAQVDKRGKGGVTALFLANLG